LRLLVDANFSPTVVSGLTTAGYDASHVGDLGLLTASDDQIFDEAVQRSMVVITSDGDFPMLLALRRAAAPSVIHLRHVSSMSSQEQCQLLVDNLPAVTGDLERGCIVSLSPKRMAVRALPIR
jgi:predicted nuclease of predicted toxin-antitoxin system